VLLVLRRVADEDDEEEEEEERAPAKMELPFGSMLLKAKPDLKAAVEHLFSVKVIGVSTMNPPRRTRRVGRFSGRRAQVKKAVVRLAEGSSIQLFPES
jgi:ribosomal protein L23